MKGLKKMWILVFGLLLPCLSFAGNWTGTVSEPENTKKVDGKTFYEITTPEELAWFATHTNAGDTLNALLMNDISLYDGDVDSSKTTQWTPIGKDSAAAFRGVFDGAGYTVSSLYVKASMAGLFGVLDSGAVVRDLKISNALVTSGAYGGLVAGINKGTVTDCQVDGSVYGATTSSYSYHSATDTSLRIETMGTYGGNCSSYTYSDGKYYYNCYIDTTFLITRTYPNTFFIGLMTGKNDGKITAAKTDGTLSVFSLPVVGNDSLTRSTRGPYYYGESISRKYYYYKIYRRIYTYRYTFSAAYGGGIAGTNSNSGTILNSVNGGDIASSDFFASGGIAGLSDSSRIVNNGNTGDILGDVTGGIVGVSSGDSVAGCSNTGAIQADSSFSGGIIGKNRGSRLSSVTNSGAVSGIVNVGGIVGYDSLGFLTDVSNQGSVSGSGDSVGGLVGRAVKDSVVYSYNAGAVSGVNDVGGLAGSGSGYLNHDFNTGDVRGTSAYAGALAGYFSGTLTACYNFSDTLSAPATSGGLAGYNSGTISNAYSAIDSIAGSSRSGLASYNAGTIKDLFFDSEFSGLDTAVAANHNTGATSDVGEFPTSTMKSAKFAWILNTVTGTETNSGTWSFRGSYPVFATSSLKPIYRVIFDNDGSTSTRYTDSAGIVTSFPEDPSSSSGAFIGWVYDTTKVLASGSKVTEDVTVTALFSETARVVVTFEDSDGTEIVRRLANDDGTVTPPPDPTPGAGEFFLGWFDAEGTRLSASSVITASVTVKAVYQSVSGTKYRISFVSDGTVLQNDSLTRGTTPVYAGTSPVRAATAKYTYSFSGWTPDISPATDSATYTAAFDSTLNRYRVVFLHATGDTLQKDSLDYGETPVYSGSTPGLLSTDSASYAFAGWTPSVASVTGDVAYTAKFDTTAVTFTVQFLVNGSVVKSETVDYGKAATAPADPSKSATDQYVYAFTGWDKSFSRVTEDLTVTALFGTSARKYLVQFYVGDVLAQSDSLVWGKTPSYTGASPSKTSTAQYGYTFSGWTPSVASVSGAATYTAVFDSTVNTYLIRFVNNSDTLQSSEVAYGVLPVYGGAVPEKEATSNYTYTFRGWDPDITRVTGAATYTAVFNGTAVPQSSSSVKSSSSSSVESSSSAAVKSSSSAGSRSSSSAIRSSSSAVIASSSSVKSSSSAAEKSSSSGVTGLPDFAGVPLFTLTVAGRTLRVENAQVNAVFAVMDMQGRVLSRGLVTRGSFSLEMPGPGAFLLRIGGDVRTVRVRM